MEGQVRGVARMIERDEDCVDVLQQTAALRAAVDSVTMLLMEDHVHGCVSSAARSGDADAVTTEVMDVVRRGMGRPARSGSRSGSEG
jgi:DNA-binding FrmR family transcriptional regulator